MDQKGQGMNPKGLKIDIKELKSGGIWGYPFLYFVDFLAFFGGTPPPFFRKKPPNSIWHPPLLWKISLICNINMQSFIKKEGGKKLSKKVLKNKWCTSIGIPKQTKRKPKISTKTGKMVKNLIFWWKISEHKSVTGGVARVWGKIQTDGFLAHTAKLYLSQSSCFSFIFQVSFQCCYIWMSFIFYDFISCLCLPLQYYRVLSQYL